MELGLDGRPKYHIIPISDLTAEDSDLLKEWVKHNENYSWFENQDELSDNIKEFIRKRTRRIYYPDLVGLNIGRSMEFIYGE